jgi:acetone monooxygenase
MSTHTSSTPDFDAIVIGAGVSGLYQLYKLRQLGLKVRVYEAGSAVGGVWYWNRYPGARCDSPGHVYQYWFSDELLGEWKWSERFPAQPETERYLNYVADKFDLRKDIQFNTRVTSAHFDEASELWTVTAADGVAASAQFLVMATGGLSVPTFPTFPGQESFKGITYHTANWPDQAIDFKGKRVGVIGTGATGIQVIQTIGRDVGHLTVFQRTPSYTIPIRNPKYAAQDWAELNARYPELKHLVHETFSGFDFNPDPRSYYDVTPEDRQRLFQSLWDDGSLKLWVGGFREVFTDQAANDELSEFVRARIRSRLKDPKVAAKLIPSDYGFGTRRVPLENGYYEIYNQDNVDLVDLFETPITRFTPEGVETTGGEHKLDVMIYATGFDAATGALTRLDLRGRGGLLLKDAWAKGVHTWLGMTVHGFPNMFMMMAPMSPAAAFCNVPTCSQQQVDWITDCIAYVRDSGKRTIEPSAGADQKWVDHHNEVANATLVPKTKSWYMGSNIEGKQQSLVAYIGGVGTYRHLCNEAKAENYKDCVLA